MLDESQRNKLHTLFDEQRERVCEIMCKPTNNVSTTFLIVLLYPECCLQNLKSCCRVKRENTILKPASMTA